MTNPTKNSDKLSSCPFCGSKPFEEIWPERKEYFSEEQRFDRINHKPDCWFNINHPSGDAFERFQRNNNKRACSKSTPNEERKKWNTRATMRGK